MKAQELNVAVIGAGIAGLLTAKMLVDKGYKVKLYEAASAVRGVGAGMGLAANAMKALQYLHLDELVKSVSLPLTSFALYAPDEKELFAIETERLSSQFQAGNFSVHRTDLHATLLAQLEISVETDKAFVSFQKKGERLRIQFEDDTATEVDYIIGADGVSSAVRQFVFPNSKPRYAGYWCWRGVIKAPEIQLEGSRAYWGKSGRFGMTPLTEQRWYWFACVNAATIGQLETYGKAELQHQFAEYPKLVTELLGKTPADAIIGGPVMDIAPLSRFSADHVLLIGDAAHAATPNMGQGACMAIEDVAVLQDELDKQLLSTQVFQNFERRRLSRTKYIIQNSRLAGKIAQTQNRMVLGLRNWMFRNLPASWTQAPLKRLYSEDFMKA